MILEFIEEGVKRTGVPVGASAKGTALGRILALKASPGWLVRDGDVHEWRFEGMTERDGVVYLYGPHLAGMALQDALQLPLAKGLPLLARLAHGLSLLAQKGIQRFALQTDSVFFTETGELLFLPPAIFREIRDLSTFEHNREFFESLNHPDLKEEALASYSIASAMYRIITGRFPFGGADAEELHEQARKLEIPAPGSLVPELSAEVSSLVMAGLGRSRGETVTLSQWTARLDGWQKTELFHSLSPEQKEKALREAGTRQEGSVKSFQRRRFWQKHWTVAAIVAVVVIVAGAIFGSILKNALAPRPTHGFPPGKVVEAFYTSMNTLDHMTMQACVIGKAGQGEINEATTLYVTSRVTQGYEGKSNVIAADVWDKNGRPPLVNPTTVYGVTGLSITPEQGEPFPVYRVKYDKWSPGSESDTGKMPVPGDAPKSEGHAVEDRVYLKQDRGDWVIYKIDRLQAIALPSPALAPAATGGTTP